MQTDMNDINSIVVTAKSPDHSVKARLSGGELTVELDLRAMSHHNESSLAAQCSAAVSHAFSGGERAVAAYLERRDGPTAEPPDPELRRMRERFTAELDALVTSGSSGPVTVTLRGRATAEVALRPRTVHYQSPQQLTQHLNAALSQARRARETPTLDIYMRAFG